MRILSIGLVRAIDDSCNNALGCRDALLAGALFFLARGFRSPHFFGVFGLPVRISPLSLRLPLATIFDALAQALQLYKSAVSRRVDARHKHCGYRPLYGLMKKRSSQVARRSRVERYFPAVDRHDPCSYDFV